MKRRDANMLDRFTRAARKVRTARLMAWLAGGVLAVLVGTELIYVIAANAVLRSGAIERATNLRPSELEIGWDSAYSLLPGRVHVSSFRLQMQNEVAQLRLTVGTGVID